MNQRLRRLILTIQCDLQLQIRNGFYYITAAVVIFWIILFSQLPNLNLAWLLPGLVPGNLVVTTFYFFAALILLEKEEGTLAAQVVTPLRRDEYLASKVLTLTGLALLENLAVVLWLYGLRVNWWLFGLSVGLGGALFALAGFLAVVRYRSINEFLLPSMLFTTALFIPLLAYFGAWKHWLLYLHPLQGSLVLMQAAFGGATGWQIGYGILYSLFWLGLALYAGRTAFRRFVVGES